MFEVLQAQDTIWSLTYALCLAVGISRVSILLQSYQARRALSHIPNVGHGGIFTSYITFMQYMKNARSVLWKGFDQYKETGLFKIPQADRWIVIATGDSVEDIRAAPDTSLSLEAAMIDLLQSDYTLGKEIRMDMYHLGIFRGILTKKLPVTCTAMNDEIPLCFKDMIDSQLSSDNDWASIPANDVFTKFICRVMNRTFVGAPLCRDEDYTNINIYFAHHVMFGSTIINIFPDFLKPIVGALFNKISGLQKRIVAHVGPLIRERRAVEAAGKEKPDDMLSWLMDAAPAGHQSVESLSLRLLNVNFMALHTTAMTFTHAVFHLASKTEYIGLLRTELEQELGTNDPQRWDKEKIERCWKLDSFLKESQRLNGLGAFSLPRKSLTPYRFSNGCEIPAGTTIAASPVIAHLDPTIYDDPSTFDGLRFYKLRESAVTQSGMDTPDEIKYRLTSTGAGYLGYGGGRHACPGRFFAALEIKLIFAYLILNYDVRTEVEGVRPDDLWFGPVCTPSRSGKVLFRRRVTV
ncbi:hypothetical protein E1B28_012668 [Marasmius oreades]|uniref:Cytochrome P450 n=1 Tax=Marasmius oreades TaxID=181124 RepID=A0A9P7UNX7_9AGAR|nr:uncharacterized protein E1B28_012668 [Marasmius oreades]KAG7088698.1 hypothetical protein E1B28_012668 [Marasmius oreades]